MSDSYPYFLDESFFPEPAGVIRRRFLATRLDRRIIVIETGRDVAPFFFRG